MTPRFAVPRYAADENLGGSFSISLGGVGGGVLGLSSIPIRLLVAHDGVKYRRSAIVLCEGQFRLFFFSREEPRIHVHVAHPDGEAKFWLTPEVQLATSVGLNQKQIREAQSVIETHIEEITDAWQRHFGA